MSSRNISAKSIRGLVNPVNQKLQNTNPKVSEENKILQLNATHFALKSQFFSLPTTTSPNASQQPSLFLGILPEDVPLFVGAIIGASFVIGLFVSLYLVWKCCCSMTILGKKKQYWLQSKEVSNNKLKYKLPVQKSSVVFLGLKPTHQYSSKEEKLTEENCITKFISTSSDKSSFGSPIHCIMSSEFPSVIISRDGTPVSRDLTSSCDELSVTKVCSVIPVSAVINSTVASQYSPLGVVSSNDIIIPEECALQDSPSLFHRSFHSDRQSLYSFSSRTGSEFEIKKACSFTWSNYSLRRPCTTDCYNDLFQKANFCKKKKNRMRSDIAAAIALNKSQASQINQDTELLVQKEVEVVIDERTAL